MQNFFKVLGVPPIASSAEIHDAYKAKSLIFHPDVFAGPVEKFVEIRDAYEVLKTENERARHLAFLKLTAVECPVCTGQGVIWKQKGFTARKGLVCMACDGAGYE